MKLFQLKIFHFLKLKKYMFIEWASFSNERKCLDVDLPFIAAKSVSFLFDLLLYVPFSCLRPDIIISVDWNVF